MSKNILLTDLLGNQHSFEVLQASLTFKNSKNVVKSGCFENICDEVCQFSFEMKEGYKVSCVKKLIFC